MRNEDKVEEGKTVFEGINFQLRQKNHFTNLEHAKASGCYCKMDINCSSGKYT